MHAKVYFFMNSIIEKDHRAEKLTRNRSNLNAISPIVPSLVRLKKSQSIYSTRWLRSGCSVSTT